MTKKLSKLLLCMALVMTAACQNGVDEPSAPMGETAKVSIGLSRAAASEFGEAGISEITVVVYKVERKGTTLVSIEKCTPGEDTFEKEFPLGETYQTVAIANASAISGTETLDQLTVHLDPAARNDVWVSNVARFSSDKSVSEVSLKLVRRVAQLHFRPAETPAELSAISDYDNINVTFRNVATAYKVNAGKAEATEVMMTAPASSGFATSLNTFDTTTLEDNGKIVLEYTQGGNVVKSSYELDCDTKFVSGTRYTLSTPITDPTILAGPSSRSASAGMVKVEVENL